MSDIKSLEPVAWFIADDNGEVYRATGYEHERDQWRAVGHEVYPLYATPVADSPMAKDAERYRWLRSEVLPFNAYASGNPNWTFPGYGPRGESFDAAIDAALAASEPKKGV